MFASWWASRIQATVQQVSYLYRGKHSAGPREDETLNDVNVRGNLNQTANSGARLKCAFHLGFWTAHTHSILVYTLFCFFASTGPATAISRAALSHQFCGTAVETKVPASWGNCHFDWRHGVTFFFFLFKFCTRSTCWSQLVEHTRAVCTSPESTSVVSLPSYLLWDIRVYATWRWVSLITAFTAVPVALMDSWAAG